MSEVLKDLVKAKAVFQQRTVRDILEQKPIGGKDEHAMQRIEVDFDCEGKFEHLRPDDNGRFVLHDQAEKEIRSLEDDVNYWKNIAETFKMHSNKIRNSALEEAAHLIECDGDALGGKIRAAKAIRGLMNWGSSNDTK